MNIGIVTPYYPDTNTSNSGLANHFSTLAYALTKTGNKVVVLHIRPANVHDSDTFEKREIDGLTLLTHKISLSKWISSRFKDNWVIRDFFLKMKSMQLVFKELDMIIEEHKLQVIETTSFYSLCYLYLFKKQKLPVIVRVSTTFLQIMDNHYPFKSRLLRLIGKLEIKMIKKSRFLITHARGHASEMENLYKINATQFAIIPHGVKLPAAILPITLNDSQIKILYIGRFEYRKGIDILLNAIPEVLKTSSVIHFELIGADEDNTYEIDFRARNSAKNNEKVKFYGNLNNDAISAAYAACDIFVAPSRYESFGLIYIEAMSYGKPVIGCKVGGVTEIIEDFKNGLFVRPDDSTDLAAKLIYLIKNEQLRAEMGKNARKTVKEKFTDDKLAENSLVYYKKAVDTLKSA